MWPQVDPERCAAIVDVNLRGVVLGTQLALEPMQRSGGGVIVNTSSGAAFMPLPPQAVYAATKAGVVHFTRSCTHLAESHAVRVNCVCPGVVDTDMARLGFSEDGTSRADLSDQAEFHPMKRVATAEEVAKAILYLASPDAGFITGAALPIDGGVTAGGH